MGFADFHFGSGNPPPPGEYPPQTVAYFRWTWDELEPSEGKYDFGMVDNVIRQAKQGRDPRISHHDCVRRVDAEMAAR